MLRRVALAIGAVGLCSAPLTAQSPASQSAMRLESAGPWVDSVFGRFVTARTPGCAVGLTRDGSLALTRTYGLADVDRRVPITPGTRFYVASLSKQFTAMAVVLLAQDGRLSLDDSIQRWVPELPSFGARITVRELLQHTSGLRDYYTLLGVAGWPADGTLTEAQFLDLISHQKTLNFRPGDEFLYSNTGYALLSIIVRRASGRSLRDFADERIFRPLGMTHTEFRDDHTEHIPDAAVGYDASGAKLRVSESNSDVVGDGGVFTTVGDLAKWDANFTSAQVGGTAGVALLQEPGRLNDAAPVQYGFGLALGTLGGLRTVSHSGAYGGFRSEFLRFPDRNVSVITLCNTTAASTSLAEQVALVVLGIVPQKVAVATPDHTGERLTGAWAAGATRTSADSAAETRRKAEQLAEITGQYYSDELGLSVTLVGREGALVMQRPKAEDIRFTPFTADLFANSDQMYLLVVRDDRGEVSGFMLTISRVRDLEFRKEAKAKH
ncbi:MAG TPA: serine hydrolase domain-containing protein [Gemmatimonadaceae bacterium]|nr:serine hydrolase domain-containing protein [Gemmatimonadaceae bacterium]